MKEAQADRKLWRSLGERSGSQEFKDSLEHEFPWRVSEEVEGLSRRGFWRLMGASMALAGFSGCTRQPAEAIVPYVYAPEQVVPGKPLFFATAMPREEGAIGLLVESHEGRPTKIEGNPKHPASRGASDAFAQASILDLYDPDRSQAVTHLGRLSSWLAFLKALQEELDRQRQSKGATLRILTETVVSPTLARQLELVLAAFPAARWYQYEPAGRDMARRGAQLAFGQYVNTYYRLEKADVVLALDADFLSGGPGSVRYARDFASRRRPHPGMNRLYAVESTPTNTGASADHRLPMRAGEIESFLRAVAAGRGIGAAPAQPDSKWIAALVRDLQAHRGSSLVIAGDQQPPSVHALAHLVNHALGNVGNTVIYTDPIETRPVDQIQQIGELAAEMRSGRVDALLIVGGNPVYSTPADLDFANALSGVRFRAHLSLYEDETSALCHWHIPEAHYLESWSDTRAFDGTASVVQPLIAPLYQGKSSHELLAAISGRPDQSGYELVREYWRSQNVGKDFEGAWRLGLHEGLIPESAFPPKYRPLKFNGEAVAPSREGLEIVFRPDPTIWDGRFANNGWLQELPKPLTKLTWDNAALLSLATAQRLNLESGDLVDLRYRGRSVRAPVWIAPGHADQSVTVTLGYGRTRSGRLGSGAGFNAYLIRPWNEPWIGSGVEIHRTGKRSRLASTQEHHAMEGREPVGVATLSEYAKDPDFVHKHERQPPKDLTIYPTYRYEGYAWGMAIDLNACIGCNACVVACVAENNIPVVGKEQVANSREMHWLQIDRYYEGSVEDPKTYFQPRLCMHCENAPCELVCPVGATVHSSEGLNEMVYNRCVGTRYCSNNCPYKVRHFNFLLFSDYSTPSLQLMRNPNVTVRSRGVMEKCTYCVQRINAAKITAEKEDRRVGDGEIVTACQAACPAQAIVFGDLNDPSSRVSRMKAEQRNYSLLADLNTRPRTTYLGKLWNPNPQLEAAG